MRKRDGNEIVVIGRALSMNQVLWPVTAERSVTFHEANVLMRIELDKREEDVQPTNKVIEDSLDVEADMEDD